MAIIASMVIAFILLHTFIIGFNVKEDEVHAYAVSELRSQFQIEVIQLNEMDSVHKGKTVSHIYKITDESGDEKYMATVLLKSVVFNRYKTKTAFIFEGNNTGVLAEGYLKTFVYDVKDQHLCFVNAYTHTLWVIPIIMGCVVFIVSLVAMIAKSKMKHEA